MPDRSPTYTDPDAAQKTRDAIAEAAQRAKHRAKQLTQTAADKADEQRSGAADALHSASSTLHETAEKIPSDTIANAAHSAASRLESAADYVEQHDTGEILDDIMAVVKRHPGTALCTALSLGFIAGVAIRRR